MKSVGGAAATSGGSSDSDKTSSTSSQPVVRRLKYEMCKNWREKGHCKYGDKCLFAHGEHELTKRSSLNGPEPKISATTPAPAAATASAQSTSKTETQESKTEVAASILIKDSAKEESSSRAGQKL